MPPDKSLTSARCICGLASDITSTRSELDVNESSVPTYGCARLSERAPSYDCCTGVSHRIRPCASFRAVTLP